MSQQKKNLPTPGTRRRGEPAGFKSLDTGLPRRLARAIELCWGLEAHPHPDIRLSAGGFEPRGRGVSANNAGIMLDAGEAGSRLPSAYWAFDAWRLTIHSLAGPDDAWTGRGSSHSGQYGRANASSTAGTMLLQPPLRSSCLCAFGLSCRTTSQVVSAPRTYGEGVNIGVCCAPLARVRFCAPEYEPAPATVVFLAPLLTRRCNHSFIARSRCRLREMAGSRIR